MKKKKRCPLFFYKVLREAWRIWSRNGGFGQSYKQIKIET